MTDELKTLTDALTRHGNAAAARLLEDGIVVEVVFRGRPTTVPGLARALEAEVADRRRLLDEREREILENHLVNEVASTLQELISAAEAQVARMNVELSERPTSTGMRLRLLWLPREDGPAGLAAARERLLRQTSDAWSAEDRAAVGGFLQARIAVVKSPPKRKTSKPSLFTCFGAPGKEEQSITTSSPRAAKRRATSHMVMSPPARRGFSMSLAASTKARMEFPRV